MVESIGMCLPSKGDIGGIGREATVAMEGGGGVGRSGEAVGDAVSDRRDEEREGGRTSTRDGGVGLVGASGGVLSVETTGEYKGRGIEREKKGDKAPLPASCAVAGSPPSTNNTARPPGFQVLRTWSGSGPPNLETSAVVERQQRGSRKFATKGAPSRRRSYLARR